MNCLAPASMAILPRSVSICTPRCLSSAVKVERKLRGLPDDSRDNLFVIKELSLPVAVDLPLAVELPTEYIADQNTRLKLYRRMADVSSPDQLDAMAEEMQDRFGEIPQEVANLFFQLRVKLLTEMAGLASVYCGKRPARAALPAASRGFSAT